MTKNLDSNGLQSIADNYDLFYIDLWGVVHNGIKLHEKAMLVLKKLKKMKKNLIIILDFLVERSLLRFYWRLLRA